MEKIGLVKRVGGLFLLFLLLGRTGSVAGDPLSGEDYQALPETPYMVNPFEEPPLWVLPPIAVPEFLVPLPMVKADPELFVPTPETILAPEPLVPPSVTITTADAAGQRFLAAHNLFALDFFHATSAKEGGSNFAITPFSLSQVLTMLALGSCGTTRTQLEAVNPYGSDRAQWAAFQAITTEVLAGKGKEDDPPVRSNGNKVWGQEGYILRDDYLTAQDTLFAAAMDRLAFTELGDAFRPLLQAWAQEATLGLMEYVVPSVEDPKQIRLVLANGFARLDRLREPFADGSAFEGLFEELDGRQFRVPMFRRSGSYFGFDDERLTLIDLPLADSEMGLLLFLPKEGRLAEVEANLAALYAELPDRLATTTRELILPLFSARSYHWDEGARQALEERGVESAFAENSADFCRVNGLGYTFTSSLAQDAMVTFTGRELRSAGSSFAMNQATHDEPPDVWIGHDSGCFISDSSVGCFGEYRYRKAGPADARPFLFVLHHRRLKAIVAMGRVTSLAGTEAGRWECAEAWNRLGNIVNDYRIDQADLTMTLRLLTGKRVAGYPDRQLSVDDDHQIGLEDAIFPQQWLFCDRPTPPSHDWRQHEPKSVPGWLDLWGVEEIKDMEP